MSTTALLLKTVQHLGVAALVTATYVMTADAAASASVTTSPFAVYSLDAQQQFNGSIVRDIPASGTYSAPTSVTLTSTAPLSTISAGVTGGFFGPESYASGLGFGGNLGQNNDYFQSTSTFTYWFELSTSGYSGPPPSKIFIDLTYQLSAAVTVTGSNGIGGSSSAIAGLQIPSLVFYSQAVQNCGNTGPGGISCFLNFGQPAGLTVTYNGVSTLYPTATSFTGTQVLTIKYPQYNTWFDVDLSAFCNMQASYPSTGGSRMCNALADPKISFDPSNPNYAWLISNFAIEQSPNLPVPTPEPGCFMLLASGAAGLGVLRRSRR